MNQSYEEIIKLIQENSSLSEEEVNSKVNDKLNQLSGLISKEGAAHIIANELGVNVAQNAAPAGGSEQKLKINKIMAGMRNVETVGKIVQKYEIREFNANGRQGKVGNFLLGDDSGVMRVVLWNELTDLMEKFNEGDVVKISSAYSRNNNGRAELHLNNMSKFEINPENETVSEVKTMSFDRKKISELEEGNNNIEVLGTIVQAFEPRFFEVCPDCNKRARPAEEGYACPVHGNVNPDYSYVFNVFLDDGSDNIRIVCFKNQMQSLLEKSHEDILVYKDDINTFESVKHELLGKMLKIQGRVVKNEMFDRLEIISSRVFINPDASEELKKTSNVEDVPVSVPEASTEEVVEPQPIPESDVNFENASNISENPKSMQENSQPSNENNDSSDDELGSLDETQEQSDNKKELNDLEELEGLDDL